MNLSRHFSRRDTGKADKHVRNAPRHLSPAKRKPEPRERRWESGRGGCGETGAGVPGPQGPLPEDPAAPPCPSPKTWKPGFNQSLRRDVCRGAPCSRAIAPPAEEPVRASADGGDVPRTWRERVGLANVRIKAVAEGCRERGDAAGRPGLAGAGRPGMRCRWVRGSRGSAPVAPRRTP